MILLLASCVPENGELYVALPADERLLRASMAIRGVRPTRIERERLAADPDILPQLVDEWLASPAFGATVRDLHAEMLQVRTDTLEVLPIRGELSGHTLTASYLATSEPPLRTIEHLILEGRPYTEIVTTSLTYTDPVVGKMWQGVEHDPEGPHWQPTTWTDGRPAAGVLSDNALWRRHVSNGSNFNRLRADFIASTFLCDAIGDREIRVDGGIDLANEQAVADAVRTVDSCVACHQALDPIGAHLFGFKDNITGLGVRRAHELGCAGPMPGEIQLGPLRDFCYPLRFYLPADEDRWSDWDLRPPGFYGTPQQDLSDLGASIASDPRFAQCTARRFYGYLTQTPMEQVPFEVVARLQAELVASDHDARALVRSIVLSEGFLAASGPGTPQDPVVGLLQARPEQLARSVEALTGYRWIGRPDAADCGNGCWGQVDLLESDYFGFRAMAGGTDGLGVLLPTHAPTPTRVLVQEQLAWNAAAAVARSDLDAQQGRLIELAPGASDAQARQALFAAADDVLSGALSPDDRESLWAMFVEERERTDASGAWTLVLAALLQDPAWGSY